MFKTFAKGAGAAAGIFAGNLAAEYAIAKITASNPDSVFAFKPGKIGGDDVIRTASCLVLGGIGYYIGKKAGGAA